MKTMIGLALLAVSIALPQAAPAQDAPQAPRFCEENPGFADWDFWVGEWNVHSNDDNQTLLGTNSITKHHANCLIKESWTGADGNGGFSVNYFNPVRKQWRQVWVANGYAIDYTGGLDDKGQMVLEGEIDYYQPGTSTPFRGIWTPKGNGDVVQRFEIYNGESDEWQVWFEGLYVRK
jgi:hypothetical protein